MANELVSKQVPGSPETTFAVSIKSALQVLQSLIPLEGDLNAAAAVCSAALRSGRKLLSCGNGGSACEAQHLTGELMGRYKSDRMALPAVTLNADSVLLTCIGNDYSFEDVFARQVEGLGVPGDVLIVFSTSGNSPNILRALSAARKKGVSSVAFLGRQGGSAQSVADQTLTVPHLDTARIQEAHQFLLHSLMDLIELGLDNAEHT